MFVVAIITSSLNWQDNDKLGSLGHLVCFPISFPLHFSIALFLVMKPLWFCMLLHCSIIDGRLQIAGHKCGLLGLWSLGP